MSIVNKIATAQMIVDDIFQILEDHNVEISEERNLINLEQNIGNYFEHHEDKRYTLIDYVYADGHQYIDTGIKMKNNICVKLNFKFETWNNEESLGGFTAENVEFNILKNNNGNLESSITLADNYIVDSTNDGIHTLVYNTYGNRLLYDDIQKIYDNLTGDILRYFIPVIDHNDTACLYDVVTQEFYYSAGDEDFY